MSLVTPALASLTQSQSRWLVMISPPFIPYPPALLSMGIDPGKVLVINPKKQKEQQKMMLWAMEKTLQSQCCSAVLAWPEYSNMNSWNLNGKQASSVTPLLKDISLRRLQQACKNGNTWGLVFRPSHASKQFSPAELRLQLAPENKSRQTHLHILKRRGGWPIELSLDIRQKFQLSGKRIPKKTDISNKSAQPVTNMTANTSFNASNASSNYLA